MTDLVDSLLLLAIATVWIWCTLFGFLVHAVASAVDRCCEAIPVLRSVAASTTVLVYTCVRCYSCCSCSLFRSLTGDVAVMEPHWALHTKPS